MRPVNPGSRRQKIILYYTLAVVLPGIILGYMAFRGIRNDQALREKESRRKLETDSQAFFTAIDSSLVQFMAEHTADSIPPGARQGDPSLLALFASDSSGSKKLITHQLLYFPTELLSVRPARIKSPTNLQEGYRLEFTEKRFPEALRFYQDKVHKTTDPAEKIQALVASARLYNKMNQPDRAKDIYEIIRKDYPGSLLNGLIPVGLMSGLEILKINQDLGEKDDMKYNSWKCLELLLHPPTEYDENQFDLFYQSFKEIIPGNDPLVDSLFKELDFQKARTESLIKILKEPDPDVNNSKNGMSVFPVNSLELTAMYLFQDEKNGEVTGMVIDFPVYLKSISEKLIRKINPDSSINVKIEDQTGKQIFSRNIMEGTGYFAFPFPENFPKWKLLLSENKPGFMATLWKAGSGIYLLIFILIALLMVLGFVFIMYALNEELRLNKLKSDFISNVSHELKSPLTSIRMMTEMLHHHRVPTEERKSAYYSAMLEESERLSHLIDNILDFSRMDDDRKKYDFAGLDMNELIGKFLESTWEMLLEPSFSIRYLCQEPVPSIRADRNAMLQVLYNLVDNAIKFSGTSRQIDITLSSKEDELQLSVKDYGIGISGKDQEKIFARFYRCEETQKLGIKGSGIGLTIVKKIIEVHNGQLTVESKPGEGSRFTVGFPLRGI
jgi:signal transduction histidine kinase